MSEPSLNMYSAAIARLSAIDPKLLSFFLLLASVSLYLVIKAKTSPRNTGKTSQTARERSSEAANHQSEPYSQERREKLIKRALEVQKICAEEDVRFLKELEEMKVFAKRYQEEVLNAGEDAWVIKERPGKGE